MFRGIPKKCHFIHEKSCIKWLYLRRGTKLDIIQTNIFEGSIEERDSNFVTFDVCQWLVDVNDTSYFQFKNFFQE